MDYDAIREILVDTARVMQHLTEFFGLLVQDLIRAITEGRFNGK
jgi:hypothetical protein